MVPVVTTEELYAQVIEGKGHMWKSKVVGVCKKYRLTIQTFFFHAAHAYFPELKKRARRKFARRALAAFLKPLTGPIKEPVIEWFARAFAAVLHEKCPELATI